MRFKKIVLRMLTISILAMLGGFPLVVQADTEHDRALSACADKSEGIACEYMNQAGITMDGFCRVSQGDGKLICVPIH